MKTLNLILQKKFANEILAGTKTREYRDYIDFYATKLIDFEHRSEHRNFATGTTFEPVKIDVLRFYWYTKDYLLVECLGWAVMTIAKARQCRPEALLYDCQDRNIANGGKSLYDAIVEADEYDFDDMKSDDVFLVFQLGKVLENHREIKQK